MTDRPEVDLGVTARSGTLTFRDRFAHFLRLVACATASGAIAGVVVVGGFGRLAMRVLAITSDERVHGAFSDDAEVIGQFTLEGTIGFIVFAGLFFGLGGGVLYAVLRPFLSRSRWLRVLAAGGVFAAIGTPIIVKPDGRDFGILEPAWLAVALFVVLSFGLGALTALIHDRTRSFYETAPLRVPYMLAFAPMLLLIPAFPLLIGVLVFGAMYSAPIARERGLSTGVLRGGQALLVVGALVLAGMGVDKIVDVETRDPRPSDFVEPVFD